MGFEDDEHLDVCQNIEFGLKGQYEANPALTDSICIYALDNAKVAVKQQFGYAKKEKVTDLDVAQGIIEWCKLIGQERVGNQKDLSLKDYVKRIDKVKNSVRRHSAFGTRAYYEFICQFF